LQATNEELETLNEELQATVEELNTTNDDLQARSVELQDLAISLEDQRHASEAERARLAAILSGLSDAVLVVNRVGGIVQTNTAYQTFFGDEPVVPLNELGQPLPPEAAPLQRAARGETFTLEFTLPTEQGLLCYYEAHGQPVLDGQGQVLWGVVVIRDVTDRSLRRLQEQFVAMASHELRTPLTSLTGYLELLRRSLETPEKLDRARQHVVAAQRSTRDLTALVNDLLDVSRLTNDRLTVNLEPLDFAALVAQTVEAIQPLASTQEIRLESPDTPLMVNGDQLRLRQVVTNLLVNAVKHAPESQHIDVRLRRQTDMVELQVQDYGVGITAAALPQIFTRFFQSKDKADRHQSGLGLGLYIVKGLIEAHGGAVTADSVEGQGTTFTVRLPLSEAPPT